MDPEFWLERWQTGRIGFHQQAANAMLARHWGSIGAPAGSRVFVSLCGKSLDMAWLAARGHRVLGAELSQLAVDQFFESQGLQPSVKRTRHGLHHVAGAFELIVGDAFALDGDALASCAAVYDRAALVALPSGLRRRYADELLAKLPPGCKGLMVTLDYPVPEMSGPPFPVAEADVVALLGDTWELEVLERRDILDDEPRFAAEGLTALHEVACRMRRRRALV